MEKKSLNKIIIIGNGFDLACGLKTSIEDFIYPKYESSCYINSNNWYYAFNFISYLYIRCNFGNSREWKEFLKLDNVEDWKDIELILNHILLDNSIFDKLSNLYSDPNCKTNTNLENELQIYFSQFINRKNGFTNFIEEELKKFVDDLRIYLYKINNEPISKIKKKLLYDEIRKGKNSISIIFNYTNFDYTAPDLFNTFLIHGTLSNNNMIVGIDPAANSEYKNKENLYEALGDKIRFTKTYKKLQLLGNTWGSILKNKIDIITFYGHSLGEQDYSYFQSIFDHYSLYDSNLVLEFCYSEYKDDDPTYEYNNLIRRIAKLINKYGETLDNKDHGKNLLNKLMLEGRIVVREIVTKEIFTEEKINKLSQEWFGKN